ncbi:DUF1761 domain-containing protein [Aestuariivivens sediminicola]|uniref:DUF1761 domain-containing protein n=1 Tax=Aestuariivivens sediminicola TaxID=2913560 RepID=UPI001F5A5AB8|nr:DUF1761 domain-containing protein [Aestuariivivens sediminicola]
MNTKKLIISSVVIFIMYVIMDILFYTYVFPEKYVSKAVRPEEEQLIPIALLGLFIASCMFSYLYGEIAKGQNKFREGIKYGLALGTFMYLPLFLIFYATRDTRPLEAWLTNAAFHIIQFGIFGIVVAHIRDGAADS